MLSPGFLPALPVKNSLHIALVLQVMLSYIAQFCAPLSQCQRVPIHIAGQQQAAEHCACCALWGSVAHYLLHVCSLLSSAELWRPAHSTMVHADCVAGAVFLCE